MTRALASPLKEFYIKTDHDNKYVSVFIKSSGEAMPAIDLDALMESLNADSLNIPCVVDQGVLLSLLLFNTYKARINFLGEENFSTISIGFPYHNEKIKGKEI